MLGLVGGVLRPINSEVIQRPHPHLLSIAKDVKLSFYTLFFILGVMGMAKLCPGTEAKVTKDYRSFREKAQEAANQWRHTVAESGIWYGGNSYQICCTKTSYGKSKNSP